MVKRSWAYIINIQLCFIIKSEIINVITDNGRKYANAHPHKNINGSDDLFTNDKKYDNKKQIKAKVIFTVGIANKLYFLDK